MRTRFAASALAILISFSLLAPMAFFTAPQHAEAALATLIVGGPGSVSTIKTAFETMITAIRTTISSIAEVTTAAAQVSQLLNTWVLQPLAFILSGQLLKALTAGVISFVIGKANGTGLPQFAVDVQRSMQTVADSRALAYLQQIGQTNSPFASSISSALRNDYLQKTTLAGFWAANMCTLAASSPNVSAYLAGDWSQGGIAEWFALTTQSQNNPYLFYPIAQTQLQNVIGPGVGGATGARLAELGWGSGFASWCGAGDSTTSNDSAEAGAAAALQECSNNGGTVDQCSAVYETYLSSKVAISPGDTCTQSDGTPGVIKTPGSTIKSTLDKVLGSQQDKLVQMGNIGPEINLILGNIATVMQTVMLASNILGGSESDGLLGFGNTSSTGSPSPLSRFQNTQGYMGVGSGQVYQGAANLP